MLEKLRSKRCFVWYLLLFTCLSLLLLAFFLYKQQTHLPFEHEEIVYECAEEYEVPPELIFSVIYAESSFRENAVSHDGAMGLMQLMPATFEELCIKVGIDLNTASPYDAAINIRCGTYYLRELYDMFGSWELAVVAYNAGLGNVRTWLSSEQYADGNGGLRSIPFAETDAYLKTVLGNIPLYQKMIEERKNES